MTKPTLFADDGVAFVLPHERVQHDRKAEREAAKRRRKKA